MKKIIVAFLISMVPVLAMAAGGGMHNDKVDIDLNNKLHYKMAPNCSSIIA